MKNFSKSTIYQIYPKSFCDSNGDGVGDIRGIIEKLDYIRSLGVDYIWSTPFFKSPMNDNGYDIEDYLDINPMFGNMEDVTELITEAGKRGLGIIFDMVFNHTSTEHEWFKRALAGEEKYMNYYIFRDGNADEPPTNWQSKFGGSAWEYVPSLGKWYLHLFDVTQADLNWDNPEVRNELKKVILFWKDKGVRGFRFDVVNLISKPEIFRDDEEGDGRRFYTDGPHVHEYLKELVADTGIEDMLTVGEMSSTCIDHCIRYTDPGEKELSMCFNFHHLKIDYKDGEKWELQRPDYDKLKDIFREWQLRMQEKNGWNAVFWCNHDQPRVVSRLGDEHKYWKESAKMLACSIHMLRGTPYIYQGEEIGMMNPHFDKIEDYRDVESINYYKILRESGKSKEEALHILGERSRDNSRTPMQWDNTKYAGFSEAEPWISLPEDREGVNVYDQEADEDSVLNFYRKLVKLRKEYEVIRDGSIEFIFDSVKEILAYKRVGEDGDILVLNNMSKDEVSLPQSIDMTGRKILLSNYDESRISGIDVLRPYECIVIQ
ncbi:alpha,alpha-phosphotrehalase [Oribacterium sp. FC2011]|uniref:alpha,alpha-phosphotrehalase n=1 Tax=Oribacterium sp. FC2011 TaxID=1408311 RepID=UPI0004E103C1|nr:alpha,alpha-phosphotrehalase [Oribacterium sp. FC2011]